MILPSRHAALSRNSLHLRRPLRTSGQKPRIRRVHNAPRLASAADFGRSAPPCKILLPSALPSAYPGSRKGSRLFYFGFDGSARLEEDSKRVCQNDDHRRSVVPATCCHYHFHLVVRIPTHKASCPTHFRESSSRSLGWRWCWDRHRSVGCGVGSSFLCRRHRRANRSRTARGAMVGKFFPRSFPTLSSHKKHGRGPRTHRKCERAEAGPG